ncbi:MAG: endonuclease, partial [Catalinimonas sp.]
MKCSFRWCCLLLWSTSLFAQGPTPPADLEDAALRTWLRINWYVGEHQSLGYSGARRQLFGYVDNYGGQVTCVSSGFRQAGGFVTFPDPMNTEHTIPQSFFNSNEPMRADLHHLFPTHKDVN